MPEIVYLDENEAERLFAESAGAEFIFEGWHVFRPDNAWGDDRYEGPFETEAEAEAHAAGRSS